MILFLRVGLFTTALVIIVAATTYAGSVDVRYRSEPRTELLTNTLFQLDNPAGNADQMPVLDAVFFGASRTRRAINVRTLSKSLEKKLGRSVQVRDLGAPFAGMGVRYIEIRDLLRQRSVNTLVVEYSPKFEQVQDTHPDFFRLASIDDILEDPLTAESWTTRQSQRLSMIARKYAVTVSVAGRNLFSELPRRSYSPEPLTEVWANGESIAVSIAKARRAGEYLTPTVLRPNTRTAQRTEFYVRKIINLAERHGTRLIFWTIPNALKLDYNDWSKSQFKTRYGYSLFSVPDDLRKKLRRRGYADAQHLNRDGAMKLQGWVVELLTNHGGLTQVGEN